MQFTPTHVLAVFSAIEQALLVFVVTFSHGFSLPSVRIAGAGKSWRVVETARAFKLSGPAKISSEVRTACCVPVVKSKADMKKVPKDESRSLTMYLRNIGD